MRGRLLELREQLQREEALCCLGLPPKLFQCLLGCQDLAGLQGPDVAGLGDMAAAEGLENRRGVLVYRKLSGVILPFQYK